MEGPRRNPRAFFFYPYAVKLLLTGASGLAASRAWPLLAAGHDLTTTGRRPLPSPRHIPCDLAAGCSELPDEHFDALIHFASLVPRNEAASDWASCAEANLYATISLLRWAEGRVRRIVLASSCAVYGEAVRLPVGEDHPLRPPTQYALTKYGQEQLLSAFCASRGIPLTILRLGYVYGPGIGSDRAVVKLLQRVAAGDDVTLRNARTAGLHLIHTDDVAAITHSLLDEPAGIFNVVMPRHVTLLDYVTAAMDVTGKRVEVIEDNDPEATPTNWYSAERLARRDIRARVTLRDSIASMLEAGS